MRHYQPKVRNLIGFRTKGIFYCSVVEIVYDFYFINHFFNCQKTKMCRFITKAILHYIDSLTRMLTVSMLFSTFYHRKTAMTSFMFPRKRNHAETGENARMRDHFVQGKMFFLEGNEP